jgi:class 3 adenylate cyclase|tara:strand:- start:3033 stop:3200 length:168 start_codon:yes stop_codon:yes gene_type:complete
MSQQQNLERQLAAIMFTDIAGYTVSMSNNENFAMTAFLNYHIHKSILNNYERSFS